MGTGEGGGTSLFLPLCAGIKALEFIHTICEANTTGRFDVKIVLHISTQKLEPFIIVINYSSAT